MFCPIPFYFLQTCNGFHQSPIDVIFSGAPVDDASNADNGALTFVGYDTMDNKLKNKGGKTVVSKEYHPLKKLLSAKQTNQTTAIEAC